MATKIGKDGIVKSGSNTVSEVRSWSIEETANTIPDTVMGDAEESHLLTTVAWSGQMECYWDALDVGQADFTIGATVTLNLYPEGSDSGDEWYSGSAIVNSISRQASLDGIVEASIGFIGCGALTEATVV